MKHKKKDKTVRDLAVDSEKMQKTIRLVRRFIKTQKQQSESVPGNPDAGLNAREILVQFMSVALPFLIKRDPRVLALMEVVVPLVAKNLPGMVTYARNNMPGTPEVNALLLKKIGKMRQHLQKQLAERQKNKH